MKMKLTRIASRATMTTKEPVVKISCSLLVLNQVALDILDNAKYVSISYDLESKDKIVYLKKEDEKESNTFAILNEYRNSKRYKISSKRIYTSLNLKDNRYSEVCKGEEKIIDGIKYLKITLPF
jgi:hypothetical protein